MNELVTAMNEVNNLNKTVGVVQRGGKKYTEVFVRVEQFRKAFGTTLGIDTTIVVDDGQKVVVQAKVLNQQGMVIGSGLAEEIRGSSNVNRTSALENAETSAIGRALASLGLHGGSYASVFEIEVAQHNDAALTQRAAEEAKQNSEPNPAHAQWAEWVEGMCAQYSAAPDLRTLHDIDRGTPDEALEYLKNELPDLYTKLTTHYTKMETMRQ